MKLLLSLFFLLTTTLGADQLYQPNVGVPEFVLMPEWITEWKTSGEYPEQAWNILFYPSPNQVWATNQSAESSRLTAPDTKSVLSITITNRFVPYKLEFAYTSLVKSSNEYTFLIDGITITNLPYTDQWKTQTVYFVKTNLTFDLQWQVLKKTPYSFEEDDTYGELDSVTLIPLSFLSIQKITNGVALTYSIPYTLYSTTNISSVFSPSIYSSVVSGPNYVVTITNLLNQEFFSIK